MDILWPHSSQFFIRKMRQMQDGSMGTETHLFTELAFLVPRDSSTSWDIEPDILPNKDVISSELCLNKCDQTPLMKMAS